MNHPPLLFDVQRLPNLVFKNRFSVNSMATFGFAKDVRLNATADFQFVFAQAERFANAGLTVLARANAGTVNMSTDSDAGTGARLGLAIAKKQVRKASARNRIRRLTREAFRLRRASLPAVDIVVMCRAGADQLSNADLNQALQRCFDRLCARYPASALIQPTAQPAP